LELIRAERRFKLATRDYAALATFRQSLREFLRFSEEAAAEAGLTTRHYQVMLIVRACPRTERVTIGTLAERLLIKHHSAVGLVDRLAHEGLVVRKISRKDRRKVELRLTTKGRQVLARLAAMHRSQLQRIGPVMKAFFSGLAKRGD
jgi:DNA-binding MarR family transcriptional regulator